MGGHGQGLGQRGGCSIGGVCPGLLRETVRVGGMAGSLENEECSGGCFDGGHARRGGQPAGGAWAEAHPRARSGKRLHVGRLRVRGPGRGRDRSRGRMRREHRQTRGRHPAWLTHGHRRRLLLRRTRRFVRHRLPLRWVRHRDRRRPASPAAADRCMALPRRLRLDRRVHPVVLGQDRRHARGVPSRKRRPLRGRVRRRRVSDR